MVTHICNRSVRFISGRSTYNRVAFAVTFINKCPILLIPYVKILVYDSFLPGFRHRSGSRPEDEPFPKCSVPFHHSSPFVNNSVTSWEIDIFRRSASSRMRFNNHVGKVTEILVLGSPSTVLRPAPSRAPPLPIPPITVYYLVSTKLNKLFDLGDIFK